MGALVNKLNAGCGLRGRGIRPRHPSKQRIEGSEHCGPRRTFDNAALFPRSREPIRWTEGAPRRSGRPLVTTRVGGHVAWLAQQHVRAKRYLVATDPAYRAALSEVPKRTLESRAER